MFNSKKPSLEELPSSTQLLRSTVIAAVSAVALLVAVVLPAEYGIDPTGVGRALGLTEMGEIKQELADEADQDQQLHGADQSYNLLDDIFGLFVGTAHAQEAWQDTITFTLEPGEFTEIKATMEAGTTLFYSWIADGGRINFDLHAHAEDQNVTYEKGRGQTEGEGSFETPFAGDHGWFWRNRDDEAVTVTLNLNGAYSGIVRSE